MSQDRPSEGLALGNYANNAAIPGQRHNSASYGLLRWLWANSELPGVRKCHRVRWREFVEVYRAPWGGLTYKGLCQCGSVWACPVCAPAIRRGRAGELSAALCSYVEGGRGVLFATLTLPHSVGDRLRPLFEGVATSWREVMGNRPVRELRESLPFEFVRAAEVTHGENGWHPHLHVCLAMPRRLTYDEGEAFRVVLFRAWCTAVEARGWRPPSDEYGLSLIQATTGGVGDYVSKVEGLADELTRLDSKKARKLSLIHI